MMIKCQKCGFENQMGSIFCRECGEKLNMDAIDPNKLQKDVNKEKNIKLAKKRIKGAISGIIAILVVGGFLGVVFYNGGLRQYEEPETTEAVAKQKFNAATNGTAVGKVKYSYPEVNRMFKSMVVDPLSDIPSFAKVTAAEVAYDEAKNKPVVYLWVSIKDKVPVIYTIHGEIVYNTPPENAKEAQVDPISLDVDRLDIGRLPIFVNTQPFLNGFSTLILNEAVQGFFARAKSVEFSPEGMTVEFSKGGPTSTYTPAPSSSSSKPSSATAAAALKGGSAAAAEKDEAAKEAARAKAEAARQKAQEEKEKKQQLEEERKRKAEEYKQQQKEKEEERKRKAEEEKERKKQEKEERERQIREENERRRQEREDRRRDRQNNNYNSRSSRSSRNRY